MTTPHIIVEQGPAPHLGTLTFAGQTWSCALGRSGIIPVDRKVEGDGATPQGLWPLRKVLYRSDRLMPLTTALPLSQINPSDGWCDSADDPAYNRPVQHPYRASAENLWRADHLYDVITVLGYNDDPVVKGKGSAIFFHLLKEDEAGIRPTEGCVGLPLEAMRLVLAECAPGTLMQIG